MKFIVLLLLFVGCSDSPKFKKGDCLQDFNYNEFKEVYEPCYKKIISVGKKNYLIKYKGILFENNIYITDRFFYKTSNEKCKER